jgi:glycerophosphoryl diester phosphodiesterase
MIKRRLKTLFKSILILFSGWLLWLTFTARPAPNHPYYLTGSFSTIAHRGGGETHPENTLLSFIHSEKLGITILEMDIRLSKDQHIILFHDRTLNRTTHCDGPVSHYTLAELRRCSMRMVATSKQSSKKDEEHPFGGELTVIPTLEEIFQRFPNKKMIIEIKGHESALINGFCTMLQQYNKETQVLVGAFRQATLNHFRQICPKVATAASAKEAFRFYLLSKLRLTALLSPTETSLIMPWQFSSKKKNRFFFMDIITPSFIRQAHNKNLAVYVFTVNEPEDMQTLIDMGVDGIMTDSPKKLTSLVK